MVKLVNAIDWWTFCWIIQSVFSTFFCVKRTFFYASQIYKSKIAVFFSHLNKHSLLIAFQNQCAYISGQLRYLMLPGTVNSRQHDQEIFRDESFIGNSSLVTVIFGENSCFEQDGLR